MKKNLKKEILQYSSAAAALLASGEITAQYQYTDIPDTTISGNNNYYDLDLDQDGAMDFRIRQYADTGVGGNTNAIIIQPYTNTINRIAGERINVYNYPFNLQASTLLDGTSGWEGAGGQFTTGYMAFTVDGQSYPNSNWVGPVTNGYLGLELRKNGLPYYGWARLDVGVESESFTVKDFSINLEVDSAMIVGYELLGEMENLLDQVGILVGNDELTITKPFDMKPLSARLVDLNGRLLNDMNLENESITINTSELASGVYVLELEQHGLLRREKLLIY